MLDDAGNLEIGMSNYGSATGIKINNTSANGNNAGYTELKSEKN